MHSVHLMILKSAKLEGQYTLQVTSGHQLDDLICVFTADRVQQREWPLKEYRLTEGYSVGNRSDSHVKQFE